MYQNPLDLWIQEWVYEYYVPCASIKMKSDLGTQHFS